MATESKNVPNTDMTDVDPVLEKALKIADNHEKLINGECTLDDIGCNEVNLTYRLYTLLCETLEAMGANVQSCLTPILKLLDAEIRLPAKLSNLTRKVRRALEKDGSLQDEIISGLYKPQSISQDLLNFGVTLDSLKKGQVDNATCIGDFKIRHALELRKLASSRGITCQKVVDVLRALVPTPENSQQDVVVIRTQLGSIHRKQQKLLHLCRNEEWKEVMNTLYTFPSKKPPASVPAEEGPKTTELLVESLVARLITCYQQVTTMSGEMTEMAQGASLQKKALKTINASYHDLKSKYNSKLREIQALKEKVASLTPRNVTKKLNRRNIQIDNLQTRIEGQKLKLSEKEEELKNAQEHIKHLTSSLDTIRKDKLKLQKGRCYLKKKVEAVKHDAVQKLASTSAAVYTLEDEKLNLEEKLSEFMNEKKLSTFKDGRYTDEVREVYMNLISMGVPIGKVQQIVESVLEGLLNVGVDRLPGKTSASMMAIEAQIIGQAQTAEAMLASANNTLHLDGTRKRFKEFGSFQVSTQSGSLSLGISEMLTGDAKSFVDETLGILNQMSEVVCDSPDDPERQTVKARLLQSISNTMTDRSVVNKKYCSDLEAVRRDVFGLLYDNWEDIAEEDKNKLASINPLYCGLHVIANMATAAQQALKEMSKESQVDADASTVIWQCSKALTPSGDQKSGAAEEFAAFLEGKGEKNSITSFAHNRFNVLFHNGAAVLYHHQDILDFLDSACPNSNKLLQAIQSNLSNISIVSQCHALGIIDKIITGPLFRILEQKNKNIFSLNDQWLLLVEYLEANSEDPAPLLDGEVVFTDEAGTITRDRLFQHLLNPSHIDPECTKAALKKMCSKMAALVKRQLKDQLPKGRYFLPSQELLGVTGSAPLTNKISEADFSDLDRLVHRAPQKSTIGMSAAICYTRNKSSKWLQSLSSSIKSKYLKRARELAPERKRVNFSKMKDIRAKRRELQQERQAKKKTALEKKLQKEKELKNRIENKFGVIENEAAARKSVAEMLCSQPQNKIKKFLKDQILYHKFILNSTFPEKSLGQWRHDGKEFTLDELLENLIKIIQVNWPDSAPEHTKAVNAKIASSMEQEPVHAIHRVQKKRITEAAEPHQSIKSRKKALNQDHLPCAVSCSIGSYVAVAFEGGKWFPGQVLQMDTESSMVDIMYLHPSGSTAYMWPKPEDRSLTHSKYIFANVMINSRDSRGRLWDVEDRQHIQEAYEAYARAYFQ